MAALLEAGKPASVSSLVFSSWSFLSQMWMERGHGDFLTSANKPFHCHSPGNTSRPDRPGLRAAIDSSAAFRRNSPLVPSPVHIRGGYILLGLKGCYPVEGQVGTLREASENARALSSDLFYNDSHCLEQFLAPKESHKYSQNKWVNLLQHLHLP